MKIGVGFRNGIGNFSIMTSILRCLAHHSQKPVDVLLDDDWKGETKEAIVLLANNLPFIEEVVSFPSQFDPSRYSQLYMSTHNGFGPLLNHILGEEALNVDKIAAWGEDFFHERDHYLMEIQDQFKYKGPIFDQVIRTGNCELSWLMKLSSKKILIAISNGYLRTASGIWGKKSYNRFRSITLSKAN